MKIACIVQARMGSTRLPGKMLMDLGGQSVLWHTLTRARHIGIPVILTIPETDKQLVPIANHCGAVVNFGPEEDVLARYYYAAAGMRLGAVMRLCGDQPLLDPDACMRVLAAFKTLYVDWCANDYHLTYPLGLGCEVFTFQALELAHQQAKKPADREHVIPWITRHSQFAGRNLTCPVNGISDLRLTIDTVEDLSFVRRIEAELPHDVQRAGPCDYSLKATLEAMNRAKANHFVERAES